MATCKNTLFIRHLPHELTNSEKEDFLKHFGATAVKILPENGPLANCAFATYKTDELADQALNRLHQLELLDCRLSVQYAKQQHGKHFPHIGDFNRLETNPETKKIQKKQDMQKILEEFYHKISGLAEKFGMLYPISPKLRYHYPPPSPSIIANISHALVTVPKFYTQVLHLMNKMNLPAPFGPPTPIPLMKPDSLNFPVYQGETVIDREGEQGEEDMSEDESEISSDETSKMKTEEFVMVKRSKKDSVKHVKRLKLHHLQTPQYVKAKEREPPTNPEEVFEVSESQMSKKIELKLPAIVTSINPDVIPTLQSQESPVAGGFGQFEPTKTGKENEANEEANKEQWIKSKFISRREIKENRLSKEEIRKLPVFKNYQPGKPTTRLYIKNLSKQVEEKDIYAIYGYYVNEESQLEKNMFDIRVMKEGRMKGQAFVNLPNEKKAEAALKDTNGYILFGKPLVVQYARSAKPKDN